MKKVPGQYSSVAWRRQRRRISLGNILIMAVSISGGIAFAVLLVLTIVLAAARPGGAR